jgi:hypothetical protein
LILTISESHIRPEIVRVAYPVEETIKAIRESTIPDFYADFLVERTDVGLPVAVAPHLPRQFLRITGRTAAGVAQTLLRQGESLKIVATTIGYTSSTALIRVFRQCLGLSPIAWLTPKPADARTLKLLRPASQ